MELDIPNTFDTKEKKVTRSNRRSEEVARASRYRAKVEKMAADTGRGSERWCGYDLDSSRTRSLRMTHAEILAESSAYATHLFNIFDNYSEDELDAAFEKVETENDLYIKQNPHLFSSDTQPDVQNSQSEPTANPTPTSLMTQVKGDDSLNVILDNKVTLTLNGPEIGNFYHFIRSYTKPPPTSSPKKTNIEILRLPFLHDHTYCSRQMKVLPLN